MTALAVVFWLSLGVCVYVYAGYPLLLWALARSRPKPVAKAPHEPPVSLVIPVHDEEAVLEDKMRNSLAQDYPADHLEIVVASDGSTDRSVAIARSFESERVRVLDLPRGGKARGLNAAATAATGEILVFTDANSMLDPTSLRRLVECFADPEVGAVCGNRRYRTGRGADATERGENLYWRFDKWQKAQESRIGSVFASDGTLHAVRRALYVPIEDPAQADDIAISTRVVLAGHRLVYEPGAVAWEEAPVEGRAEFRRKIRVTVHSVRALLLLGPALFTSGFYSVELLSHKLVRHLVPFFLVPLVASSAALAAREPASIYGLALAGQIAFYLLAVAGFLLRHRPVGRARLLSVPYYFSLVNLAALLGVLRILRGERPHAWSPRGA